MERIPLQSLGGLSLNVERVGSGPHIMAIHGFTGCAANWRPFASAAREGFSVISVDMLGHGASDSPNAPEFYSVGSTIQALREIMDKLDIRRVHWVGYSMGGRIALGAALALDERTSSLTLESASPGLLAESERASRVLSDETLAQLIQNDGVEAFIRTWENLPMWTTQTTLPEGVRREVRNLRLANNTVGLANSLRGMGSGVQPSFHGQLSKLKAPTLIIAGAEDSKFAEIARQMSDLVHNSRLWIVPEAGHTVHLEKPGLFSHEVLGFIRSTQSASAAFKAGQGSRQVP